MWRLCEKEEAGQREHHARQEQAKTKAGFFGCKVQGLGLRDVSVGSRIQGLTFGGLRFII